METGQGSLSSFLSDLACRESAAYIRAAVETGTNAVRHIDAIAAPPAEPPDSRCRPSSSRSRRSPVAAPGQGVSPGRRTRPCGRWRARPLALAADWLEHAPAAHRALHRRHRLLMAVSGHQVVDLAVPPLGYATAYVAASVPIASTAGLGHGPFPAGSGLAHARSSRLDGQDDPRGARPSLPASRICCLHLPTDVSDTMFRRAASAIVLLIFCSLSGTQLNPVPRGLTQETRTRTRARGRRPGRSTSPRADVWQLGPEGDQPGGRGFLTQPTDRRSAGLDVRRRWAVSSLTRQHATRGHPLPVTFVFTLSRVWPSTRAS